MKELKESWRHLARFEKEEAVLKIIRLNRDGLSIQELVVLLSMSRATVEKYVGILEAKKKIRTRYKGYCRISYPKAKRAL